MSNSAAQKDNCDVDKSRFVGGTSDAFREMCRGIGSTVSLVATEHDGRRFAMVATSVCSVSMDPPSLLICVNTEASAYHAVVERAAFSLGILHSSAGHIGDHVARMPGSERFSQGNWSVFNEADQELGGLPWLSDSQATAFCLVEKRFDYGTHSVFVARVRLLTFASDTHDPLLYCEGRFGRFQPVIGGT